MPRLTSQQGAPSATTRLIDKPFSEMTDDEAQSKLELLRGARLQAGAKSSARKASVGNKPTPQNANNWVSDDEDLL